MNLNWLVYGIIIAAILLPGATAQSSGNVSDAGNISINLTEFTTGQDLLVKSDLSSNLTDQPNETAGDGFLPNQSEPDTYGFQPNETVDLSNQSILDLEEVEDMGTILTNSEILAATPEWAKTYGGYGWDAGYSVQQTTDGGYVVAGTFETTGKGSQVYLLKTNANGVKQWAKIYGGDGIDSGYSVQQTPDGGYIVAGTFETTGKGYQVYLLKTNANGVKQWAKTYGGYGDESGRSVQQTVDGGYIVAGTFDSSSAKNKQVYLVKTNANGVKQWAKTYGGYGDESGRSVQQTTDGGYIVAGTFETTAKMDQVYLVKTNVNGVKQWAKTYGGYGDDYGYSVQQTTDGGYIVAGTFETTGKSFQVYLIKTNANGVQQWAKTYGGDGYDYGQSVQQTVDGGYIITGAIAPSSTSTKGFQIYLVKTNANGGRLWARRYGGDGYECGRSVRQASDGGYIIAGETDSFGKDNQVYLVRAGPDG